ncbi:unnamed protein product [Caenorhabditis angaria]|uniref:Uncharacterized protein n=1 Tax=Caenorhabditis angaria TaxID=860376 RepID=A0A9P1MWZ7_9PELO|nr:unnamed protein product [Caenorhabditis angaria]
MSNNLSRLLLLLFLVLIFLVDGTPRRSRVSQASKAFEEKDNKFEYSHSPGTIDEEENEEDSESETTISSTVEASTSTTKIKTTTTTTEKSVSEEKPEELDNVFTFLQEIGETIQDGFDQNDTSSTLIIDTHYKALDWNLTVDEMDECVKWQKYWNITAKMKNGTDLNNTVAENSEEEEETIELVDLKVKEEIDSSKRLKAIGFDPEILDEYELKKVVIYYEEVCGNHGRTFWFRTRDEAKQIGVDESSPICAPFKEKIES